MVKKSLLLVVVLLCCCLNSVANTTFSYEKALIERLSYEMSIGGSYVENKVSESDFTDGFSYKNESFTGVDFLISKEKEGIIDSPSRRNWYRSSSPYDFAVRDILFPLALIVGGSTSQYIKQVNSADSYIRDAVQYGHRYYTFDDYLQYSPYLLLWTLDACGVKSMHKFKEQTTNLAVALAIMGVVVNTCKYTISRQRPSGSSYNSMPSGHTAMAFTGAEFLRMEFKETSPWIGAAGYALATTTAFMRVWNNRHYVTDTLFGAGVGILSVRAAYWIAPAINKWIWGSDLREEKSPLSASMLPYADGQSYGVNLQMTF